MAFAGTGWLLVGCLQLLVMLLVIAPLQKWRPVEPVTDRAAVRVDVLYTLIHRLGVVPDCPVFTLEPLFDALFSPLRAAGVATFHLDGLWPGVTDLPWVAFAVRWCSIPAIRHPPWAAPVHMVVESAFLAPLPAADVNVDRQP